MATAKNQKHLQDAHDALNKLGARCNKAFVFEDSEPGDVSAPNDHPGNHGATAQAKTTGANTNIQDKAEPSGDLRKIADENAALRKLVAGLTADIEALKAQPASSRVRLRAVGKGDEVLPLDDKAEKIESVRDAHGNEREAATLIKGIHQTMGDELYKF